MWTLEIRTWESVNPANDFRISATAARTNPSDVDPPEEIFLYTEGENGMEYLGVASVADLFRVPLEGSEEAGDTVRRSGMDLVLTDRGLLEACRDEMLADIGILKLGLGQLTGE